MEEFSKGIGKANERESKRKKVHSKIIGKRKRCGEER